MREHLVDKVNTLLFCLLIFEVKQDGLGDVILLSSQGVSFSEVQEGLNFTLNTGNKTIRDLARLKGEHLCHSK